MNTVVLIGRLCKEVDFKIAAGRDGDMPIARYTLAVDRKGKKDEADFIPCVCFGKTADFASKYLHKGMKIAVEGRIQTGSYTNRDGQKVYTTDVIVDSHEFCERKTEEQKRQDDFMNIPPDIEEEMPFGN